jgi:hypothetical protein
MTSENQGKSCRRFDSAPSHTSVFIGKFPRECALFRHSGKTPEMKENTALRNQKCHAVSCKAPPPRPEPHIQTKSIPANRSGLLTRTATESVSLYERMKS